MAEPYRSATPPAASPGPLLEEVSADRGDFFGEVFVDELRRSRDEVLEVHGHGDLCLYERLLRDDQVSPAFLQRRLSVIEKETKVDPGGPSELDKLAADDLRQQIQRLSWDRTCFRMLAGLMYGYSVGECMFRLDDASSRIVLDAVKVRRSRRFRFGLDGSLRLLRCGQYETMPPQKFWTATWGADDDDDPYGRGLGHYLYWPVWFKRNGIRFWSLWLETLAAPIPRAQVPPGSNEAERQKVLAMLDMIRAGGKLVVPRGVDVNFLEAVKDSGGSYDTFVQRMDASISKVVVTQTMTMDDGASLAQGQVHERKLGGVAKSDSDMLTESFQNGPARWLTEWNFPGAATPIVYRDFGVAADLKAVADRDAVLNTIGYRPTPDYVRETYGDGYQLVEQPTPAQVPGAPAFAEAPRDASDAIEDLLMDDGWRRVMGPEVDRVERLLKDARTLDEVRDRLGELALSDPTPLVDSLSRVMFAARVQGAAGAESTTPDPTSPDDGTSK